MRDASMSTGFGGGPASGLRDRRLHPRVADQIDVTIYAMGLPAPVEGRTRDIGPEGLCVETESPIGLEGARRIVLHLDDGDPNLKVSCCWQGNAPGRDGVLSGFRFIELDMAQTEILWSVVFRRAREVASFMVRGSALQDISFDDALDVAMHSRLVRFAPGDWIYRQGAEGASCDSAYLVLRGTVALEAVNERAESVYVDSIESGELFGGLPMLAPVVHPETAVAQTACELVGIDRYSYQYLLTDRASAGYAISRALVGRYAARMSSLIGSAEARLRSPFSRFVGVKDAGGEDLDVRVDIAAAE